MDNDIDLDVELDRLAQLPRTEYEKVRKETAKRLDLRVSVLDEEVELRHTDHGGAQSGKLGALKPVEPWPEPVIGGELVDRIVSVLLRFMVLSREQAISLALWTIYSHVHDAAEHSPILAIQSPEKRCGKTTLLQIISRLVPRAVPAANITAAAIFRAIEAWHPILLLDEGETYLQYNDDMRGVLNSGFSRDSAYVIRTVGDNHEPKQFSTWCPKVIALIRTLPDTLQDRSIVILLRRKLATEKTERFGKRQHQELEDLRAQIARWGPAIVFGKWIKVAV